MPDGSDRPSADPIPTAPTLRGRLLRAGLRALPAVAITAAIWLWFDLARRDCDARVQVWSEELAATLARGQPAWPSPATVSEWIEPTLRTMLAGLGAASGEPVEVRFVPADPQVDSRMPSVELAAAEGVVLRLRCRCAGDAIEIVGAERR